MALSLAFPPSPAAGQDACRFPDVPDTDTAHADIIYACRQGWFSGYPDGSFRPDRPVPAHQLATVVARAFAAGSTRADMATFLRGGAPGDPASPAGFADVPATHPQSEDIAYAVERSWFQGYPDNAFRPDRTITASQITTVLTRAFPTGSTRAQLATFMRNGQQALPWTSKIAYEVPVYNSLGNVAAWELWVAGVGGSGSRQISSDVGGWLDWREWEWSPDGERIVYVVIVRDSRGSPTGLELWVVGANGSGARQIIDYRQRHLLTDYYVRWWKWSPNGERIAYETDSGELWVVGADGLGERQLTDYSGRYSWSPGGEWIAYETESDELWVAEADGSNARQFPYDVRGWGWSPSGKWIAYWTESGEYWIAGVDGSDARQLTDYSGRYSWSPGGEWIAYETESGELWVAGVDGSDAHQLTDDVKRSSSGQNNPLPNWEWSPDGERIAYVSGVWEFGTRVRYDLWVAEADGSNARQFPDDVRDWGWGWSPDGERIAYETESDELWVASADGSGPRWLTDDVGEKEWSIRIERWWSPDGGRIAYETGPGWERDGLWVVGADGSGARQIIDGGSGRWGWSPDGERIVYLTGRELWVAGADGSGARQISGEFDRWGWGWSPGGERFAYLTGRELWVAGADGSGARKIADDIDNWEWQPGEG